MRKKWKNISELCTAINESDAFIDDCGGKLKRICYAPNISYCSWIFKYKGTLVLLFNMGNGYYEFGSAVSYLDVIEAVVSGFVDRIRYTRK